MQTCTICPILTVRVLYIAVNTTLYIFPRRLQAIYLKYSHIKNTCFNTQQDATHQIHLNCVRSCYNFCSHFIKGLCTGGETRECHTMGWTQPIQVLGSLLLNLCSMQKGEFSSPQLSEMFSLFTLPLKWNVASLLAHDKMTVQKGQPLLHKLHGNINKVI
jgi:hypothetical protein